MTKRIMSLIMTLVMVLSCFPAVSLSTAAQMWEAAEESLAEKETQAAAETVQSQQPEQETSAPETKKTATRAVTSGTTGDCTWSLSGTTLTIRGNGAMADYDYNDAPWPKTITKVIVEEGVTNIGQNAFDGYSALVEALLPTTVEVIGYSAFYGCSKLASVEAPDGLPTISSYAFFQCSALGSVVLGDDAQGVGYYAFYQCTALTSVTLSDSVTYITDKAFYECGNLEQVEMGNGVQSIGHQAFYRCGKLGAIRLPSGATYIGMEAFYYCTSLTEVLLPDSLTAVESSAFWGCNSLVYNVYDNGQYLGDEDNPYVILMKPVSTSATTYLIHEKTRIIHYGAFKKCTANNIVIPDSVIVIGLGAFMESRATNLTIGKGVTSIENNAFYASSLKSIVIPDNVTTIGSSVFEACTNLTSVSIGSGLTRIPSKTFYGCKNLRSITIPDNITSIGSSAFGDCGKLTSNTLPFIGGSKKTPQDTYQYPLGYIFGTSSYSGGTAVNQFYHMATITGAGSTTYYIPSSLRSVTVTGGHIPYGAFYDCAMLTSVTLKDGVTGIGEYAFANCSNLASISVADTLTFVEINAFYGCFAFPYNTYKNGNYIGNEENPYVILSEMTSTSITSATIHADTKVIGPSAFSGCSQLTKLTIPKGVAGIGSRAFYGCSALKTVSVPNTITNIGGYAFYNCTSLTGITIPNGVERIAEYTFYECNKLADSVTIPDSVTDIGEYAFYNCKGLTSVALGQKVANIGANAFAGCNYLTVLHLPDSITSIGAQAFSYCNSLTSLTIPDSVTSIGEGALSYCYQLQEIVLPWIGDSKKTASSRYQYPLGYIMGESGHYTQTKTEQFYYGSSTSALTSSTYYIPNSLKTVVVTGGELLYGAFYNCNNLTCVVVGKDVTGIQKEAFNGCVSMERIEVSPENPYYCSVNGVLCSKDKSQIIWAPENHKLKLQVNFMYVDGTQAGASVVMNVQAGQTYSVAVPEIIGYAAIKDTVSGTMPAEDLVIDVIYYENVKVTGGSCNEAISWTLYTDGKLVLRGTGTMPDYTEGAAPWAQYADQVLTVHIDSRITSIGSYAFAGCRKLTFVDYGYSVAAIGAYAFSDCTGLTSFKLPASVTAIADGAFFGCTGLKTVVIPDNITAVGENAFRGCTALVQVTVGGAVTEIGSNAFADCGKLTQIYFRGAPATLGSNALGATSGKYVYYYSTVSGWQAQITDSKWNGYVAIPYNAVAQQTFDGTNPYIIKVVDKNGLPLSGAAVVLGEASTSTNAEGMAYFVKPTQPQKLEVTCSGHIPFVDEVFAASATQLMDLVELSDSPSSVQGLRLNRTSIATTVAVINCASDETVSIAVKGTSPKYTIVRYELHQGSRLIATEKTAQASCTFRVKANAFEEGQTVLVRLYTSDGSMVASALNIDVIKLAQISEKQILGELSRINLTIGLGGLGSYKIPINPQSSGNEKFYTSIKDRTIRIGINLDVGEIFAKNDEQKAKTVLHKMVQDSMENFAKDKSGFEYNLCGYIEIEYLGNGNYYVKTSYVKLGLNAKLAFNAQASFFGVVGVYFRASLSGSASLDLHITHFAPEEGFRVDEMNFAMENTLELAGGAYVLFGIGSAEFFGSISVGFQLGIIPEFEMESVYVTGELGVRWSILWGLGSGKETLLSGDIYRWPEKTTYKDLEKRFHAVRQDPASYSFNDRAYLEDRSAWLTGEQGYLQKNIYDRVAPETVTCGDTTMMVWLDDNSQRGDTDYQSLYYSVYRDGSWSAPVAVDDDGTFDCEFDLCTDGERIYVIYTQRKNRSAQSLALSEQNDIAAFVGDVEVCVATFENGSFSRSVRLTDNAACELLPDIHWANDTLTAIWLETNAVDLTGEASGGTVYTAVLTEGTWSAPAQVVADQKSVSQVTTVCLGAKAYTVYITDTDGSGETTDDQVLVLRDGNGQAVQLETGVIANAREAVIDGVNGLTWYRGGRIYMLTDPTQKPVALTPENVTVGNDYRVISLADGQTLVLFVMGDEAGHGTDLYSVYANAEGCLTQPVRMTQTEGYITNYCVAYRDDTLVSVYTQTLAELSGEEMETVTHLATAELRFRTDITLDSALYEVTDVQPLTALPVELTVTNSGTQPVDGITVQLYHQEQLLYTTACSLALSSGATGTCEATVILPETIAEEGYTLRILPENAMTPVTDATPEDNRAELMLAYADLSVAAEQKIAGGKNYLTLTVSNLGNSATAATLALYAPDQTGKQLATLEIQAIAAGETQQYIVDVNPLTEGQDALITCLVTSQLQDPCVINDTAVIKLLYIQNEVFVTDPEQMIRNPELSVSMAEFDKHAPQNITVTVTAEAERFAAVENLVKDTDYTFRSGELVLLSSYLNKLDVGTHTLKLLFDLGAEEPTVRSLSIHVTDSAPETLAGSIAISGQVVTGGTVSADISGLTPQTSMVTYTWSVDGETVGTQSSYTVRREDLGKTLKLTVTGDEGYTGSFTAEAVVALQKPAAPAAPMVSKVESTAVTLVKVEGMEYSLDLTAWQQSNIFTALAPNESYTFYARKAATEAAQASEASLGVTVTTPKQTVTAPAAPTLAERTYNSITLTAVPGAEYRLEGGAWTQNHVFTDLQPNTTYVFFQRYQETQTTYASQASSAVFATLDRTPIAGKVSITGEPYAGATLGVELTEFTGDEKGILYQWYLDGEAIAGATQSTYTVKEADMGKTLQLRITGTGAYRGELTGQLVICDYIPGDVNADLQVDIEDAIWLLRHIFVPAWYAINQDADMNKDGRINSDDAIYLLQHTLMPDQFPLI